MSPAQVNLPGQTAREEHTENRRTWATPLPSAVILIPFLAEESQVTDTLNPLCQSCSFLAQTVM